MSMTVVLRVADPIKYADRIAPFRAGCWHLIISTGCRAVIGPVPSRTLDAEKDSNFLNIKCQEKNTIYQTIFEIIYTLDIFRSWFL